MRLAVLQGPRKGRGSKIRGTQRRLPQARQYGVLQRGERLRERRLQRPAGHCWPSVSCRRQGIETGNLGQLGVGRLLDSD